MPEIDRAVCRKYPEDCVALARITTDPVAKQPLLTRAQEWLELVSSKGDAEFERVLSAFNKEQVALGAEIHPLIQPTPTQQQPIQQQQSKVEPDEKSRRNP